MGCSHAGLLFDNNHIPYNRCHPDDLGSLIDAQAMALQESGPMPAVTGALMVIRHSDFQILRFQTDYRVCGEDIALCLDIWTQLNKHPYYASDVTAIHEEKTTRGNTYDQDDIRKLSAYAAGLIPNHSGLQAASRRWAHQESTLMWHLVQHLRHELAQEEHRAAESRKTAEITQQKLEQRITELDQQAFKAEATIQAMETSSSWQLTAPLRLLGDKLKPASSRGG